MPKDELLEWLKKNHLDVNQAKEMLKSIRNQTSRQYSTHSHDFSGQHIKIGVLGDTHFGNKWTDKSFLRDVMKRFKERGVEAVYHTGDLTDGPFNRHNNVLEQYAHGLDAQCQDFVDDFPDIGKPTFFILGNHNLWYLKQDGGNIGKVIETMRPDLHYLGDSEAIVKIGRMEMMLSHPDKEVGEREIEIFERRVMRNLYK